MAANLKTMRRLNLATLVFCAFFLIFDIVLLLLTMNLVWAVLVMLMCISTYVNLRLIRYWQRRE